MKHMYCFKSIIQCSWLKSKKKCNLGNEWMISNQIKIISSKFDIMLDPESWILQCDLRSDQNMPKRIWTESHYFKAKDSTQNERQSYKQ